MLNYIKGVDVKAKMINNRRSIITIFVVIAALLVFSKVMVMQLPNHMLAKDYLQGIDISNNNNSIDWDSIKKAGVIFAYIKRSEGTGYTDAKFEEHRLAAQNQGILWGAYHYYHFDADPIEQAQNFYNLLPKDIEMLTPAVDIELSNSGTLPSKSNGAIALTNFSNEFERLSGLKAIFYVTNDSYEKYIAGNNIPISGIWYRSTYGRPAYSDWTIWQYSDQGKFGSTKGPLDRNAFRGSQQDLDNLKVKFGSSK
jgi:lysozyme